MDTQKPLVSKEAEKPADEPAVVGTSDPNHKEPDATPPQTSPQKHEVENRSRVESPVPIGLNQEPIVELPTWKFVLILVALCLTVLCMALVRVWKSRVAVKIVVQNVALVDSGHTRLTTDDTITTTFSTSPINLSLSILTTTRTTRSSPQPFPP